MKSADLPADIAVTVGALRIDAAKALQLEDWLGAAARLKALYDLLLAEQEKRALRFHKGWELYNLGVSHIRAGNAKDGINVVLLAYIEDLLSAPKGFELSASDLPAGRSLSEFGVDPDFLELVMQQCLHAKMSAAWPPNPLSIATEALATFGEPQLKAIGSDIATPKRPIEELASPYEKCCFVGGAYYSGGPNLEDISKIVRTLGFDAIRAIDFHIEADDVHHRSLLLLHRCKKAIFEITVPAGQLMELERCRDYDVKPLLVRNVIKEQDPQVSAMISTMAEVDVIGYATVADLETIVRRYLTSTSPP